MPLSSLVTASPSNGSLTRLELSHGDQPPQLREAGNAVAQLSQLTALRELSLWCSPTSGSVGPRQRRLQLDFGGFAAFPHLSSLKLGECWALRLPAGGPPLPALRGLEAGMLLWDNPAAWAALAALTRLELCGAEPMVPRALAQLTALRHLTLVECRLEGSAELEEGEPWPGFTPTLTYLYLSDYRTKELVLPPTLSMLRHLSIAAQAVLPSLATMPGLTHLELRYIAHANTTL
jgi:hypothetical protein